MSQAKWGDYKMSKYYVKNIHSGTRHAPSGYSSGWITRKEDPAKKEKHVIIVLVIVLQDMAPMLNLLMVAVNGILCPFVILVI